MATQAIEERRRQRAEQIEANRALGVQEWKNRQEQSDAVYEVIDGYHRVPAAPHDPSTGRSAPKLTLGPGHRFHPTKQQVETGALEGKARELTESEYRGISREDRKPVSWGADIGIRALPMAETTLKLALRADLSEEDFEGIEPAYEGRYTRSQVEEIIAAKDGDSPEAA